MWVVELYEATLWAEVVKPVGYPSGEICTTLKDVMAFPIKTCVVCQEEFELKPGKPGFANRCPSCSEPEAEVEQSTGHTDREANAARRDAMRNLLYRKDS